jgi:hypothetical protein
MHNTLSRVIAWTSCQFIAMPYRGDFKALEFSKIGGAQGTFELKTFD